VGLIELTGTAATKFVVVEDPKVGKHTHEQRAQLRSLPLLYELGFSRFLHTPLWENGFRMVEYDYLDPNDLDAESASFPLVHIVSQDGLTEYEIDDGPVSRSGEQHVVADLLRTRSESDTYILVTDTNAPRTPAITTQRPLTDEYGPVTTVDYVELVERTVQTRLNSRVPLNTTKNYYIHEISDHHQRVGAPAESLTALFDYERAPPNSPVWEPLYYFVENDLQQLLEKYTERIRETLRSWLERGDVQKIANQMDAVLVDCEYRTEELDRIRAQNARQYDVDIVREEL
jgi:hypothetical protein